MIISPVPSLGISNGRALLNRCCSASETERLAEFNAVLTETAALVRDSGNAFVLSQGRSGEISSVVRTTRQRELERCRHSSSDWSETAIA